MKILIVSATRYEIGKLMERNPYVEVIPNYLYRITKEHLEVDVLTPGVGILHTGFYLGKTLSACSYDLAINAGICGAYSRHYPLGSVLHVTEESLPGLGAEVDGSFIPIFDMGLMSPDTYPFDKGRLVNTQPPGLKSLHPLQKVRGNTISTLSMDPDKIQRLALLFPAEVESMEGAAFLFGCLIERVPCIQIRSVSNYVGERDKSRWNIRLAVKNLDKVLEDVVEEVRYEGMRV